MICVFGVFFFQHLRFSFVFIYWQRDIGSAASSIGCGCVCCNAGCRVYTSRRRRLRKTRSSQRCSQVAQRSLPTFLTALVKLSLRNEISRNVSYSDAGSGGSRRWCYRGETGLGLCRQRERRGQSPRWGLGGESPRSWSINAFCVMVKAFS